MKNLCEETNLCDDCLISCSLENEHFNNMAGCKATKSLRLSFKDLAGHEI